MQCNTPEAVRRYLTALGRQRKPGRIHAAYWAIHAFLNWCDEEYQLPTWRNPIDRVAPPKVPQEVLEPISMPDLRKMLTACAERTFIGDRAILLALLDSGRRANELLSLDVADVDSRTGTVLVRQAKGNKTRIAFLGARARRALVRYLRHRENPTGPLWVTVREKRMAYSGMRSMLRRCASRAGVRMSGPHAFRRAFCVSMLRDGADLVSLQRLMGHADLAVLRRYLKRTQDDLRSVHEIHGPADHAL